MKHVRESTCPHSAKQNRAHVTGALCLQVTSSETCITTYHANGAILSTPSNAHAADCAEFVLRSVGELFECDTVLNRNKALDGFAALA